MHVRRPVIFNVLKGDTGQVLLALCKELLRGVYFILPAVDQTQNMDKFCLKMMINIG